MNKANNTKLKNYILQLGYKMREETSSSSIYFEDEKHRKLIRLSDHISPYTSNNPALDIVYCKNSNLFVLEYDCRIYDAISLSEIKNLIRSYIKFQDMVMNKQLHQEDSRLKKLRDSNSKIATKNSNLQNQIFSLEKELENANKRAIKVLMEKLNLSRNEAKELINSQV